MLNQVLNAIETAAGPILLCDLARQLDVEETIVADMITFWVRKGRLQDDDAVLGDALSCNTHKNGNDHCGPGGCPFIVKTPQTFSVPTHSVTTPEITITDS